MLLIDLDRFKSINHTHGHGIGDRVLCAASDALRRNLRQADRVGRWGGEGFMVLCSETEGAGAMKVGEKLRSALQAIDHPSAGRATASMGVATWRPGEPIESSLNRVDQGLYRAKGLGRNRVVAANG